MTPNKNYFAKVYSPTVSGTTTSGILATLTDFEFKGFSWNINQGLGECNIRLPRKFNSFGEGNDVGLFNQFDIYVQDKESGQYGLKVYSGYMVEYTPTMAGEDEYVDITLWGYPSEFSVKVLETGTDTTVAYSSQDPSNIVKDAINRYDGKISYSATSVSGTNTTVSYTFKQNSLLEVINKCQEMAPAYWYWRVGADNVLYFRARDTETIDHTLFLEKDVSAISLTRSGKELANNFYFLGGGTPVYIKTTRTSSQQAYGKRIIRKQDERVTVQGTASTIATTYLDVYDHPVLIATVTVVDSNGDKGGYDIESFQPGQIVKLVDPQQDAQSTYWDTAIWDLDSWDYPITSALGIPWQIVSIDYQLDQCTLQLAFQQPDVAKRIEDIMRNLEQNRTQSTPTTPTVV